MQLRINPGKYVVAVSGGVDSVALLHMLVHKYSSAKKDESAGARERRFVVAHFNHGMREDALKDRQLVQWLAQDYQLPFVYTNGNLSSDASEATARAARYAFLKSVLCAAGGRAIITAHHADDSLETALLNMLRGTGRKGLSALHHNPQVIRPLLHVHKRELIAYATAHNLLWREDSTNRDATYARNHLRLNVIPKLEPHHVKIFHDHIDRAKQLNETIDAIIADFLHEQPAVHQLDRSAFASLPHKVAKEVLAEWLRSNNVRSFDKRAIERLTVAVKTARQNTQYDVSRHWCVLMQPDNIAAVQREK